MSTKILIPLCAAAALLAACSERDNTRETSTPTADDSATPGGSTAPAPTDSTGTSATGGDTSGAGTGTGTDTATGTGTGTETQPTTPQSDTGAPSGGGSPPPGGG